MVPAGFVTVPERDAYWLRNATVPAALLTALPEGAAVSADGNFNFQRS